MTAGNSRKVKGWTTPLPVQVAQNSGSLLTTKDEEIIEELLPGEDDQVLTIVDGKPEWTDAGGGGFAAGTISFSSSVVTGATHGNSYGNLLPPVAIPVEATNVGGVGVALYVTDATYAEHWTIQNNHSTHDLGGEVKIVARNVSTGDVLSAVASGLYPIAAGESADLSFTQQYKTGTSISIVSGNIQFASGTYEVWMTSSTALIPPA